MPVVTKRPMIQFSKGHVYEPSMFPRNGVRWVEDKFDGLRGGIAIMGQYDMKMVRNIAFTLTGIEIPNAQAIVDELVDSGKFEMMFLDGEFRAESFADSQSIVKTLGPHPKAGELRFHVFDMMPLDDWLERRKNLKLKLRKSMLDFRMNDCDLKLTIPVQHAVVKSHAEVEAVMKEAVSRGLEGVMVKDPEAYYAFCKSNDWLKYKPVKEADFEIIGATEGRGKDSGSLGALEIVGEAEGQQIKCEVGTGFKARDREQLWKDYLAHNLIGRTVQCEYQEITEPRGNKTKFKALRFPSFQRMRDDKAL